MRCDDYEPCSRTAACSALADDAAALPPGMRRRSWRGVADLGYVDRGEITIEQLDEKLDLLSMTHAG